MVDKNLGNAIVIRGVQVPALVYGTAWKEDATRRLVGLALGEGFRGIDTANQRRHYHEEGVGEALEEAFATGVLVRADLFLQTKFTHRGGQDHRLPYDPDADIVTQVRQSFARSLLHLRVAEVDSFVLHGPSQARGLAPEDIAAWRAMEAVQDEGGTRLLGVSNVALDQLEELCDLARVPPAFVQNRCYARTGWDAQVRAYCRSHDLVYQGFSLLTANQREIADPRIKAIAKRVERTPSQVVFRFARAVGMIALTGTSRTAHMREDLDAYGFELDAADVAVIESIGKR